MSLKAEYDSLFTSVSRTESPHQGKQMSLVLNETKVFHTSSYCDGK